MAVFGHSGTSERSDLSSKHSRSDGPEMYRFVCGDKSQIELTIYPATFLVYNKRKLPILSFKDADRSIPLALAKALKKEAKQQRTFQTQTDFHAYAAELEAEAAKNRLLRLVSQRDYSIQEATKKLLQDGYFENIVLPLIDRAVAGKLLDDMRYAESFIRSKIAAGIGKQKISDDLSKVGISTSGIPNWPDAFFEEDELTRAKQLLHTKTFSEPNIYNKIVRFLYTRGYGLEVAKEAAKAYCRQ